MFLFTLPRNLGLGQGQVRGQEVRELGQGQGVRLGQYPTSLVVYVTLADSIKIARLCRTHSTRVHTKFGRLRRTPPILAQCHTIRVRWSPAETAGECKVLPPAYDALRQVERCGSDASPDRLPKFLACGRSHADWPMVNFWPAGHRSHPWPN